MMDVGDFINYVEILGVIILVYMMIVVGDGGDENLLD